MLQKINFKEGHCFPFGYVDITEVISGLYALKINALILLVSCSTKCRDSAKEKIFRRMNLVIVGHLLIIEGCQGHEKSPVLFFMDFSKI